MMSLFLRGVLDENWDLIESVSEGFSTYSYRNGLKPDLITVCADRA